MIMSVSLEIGSCPRSAHHRSGLVGLFRSLGNEVCQTPHVSCSHQAGTTDAYPHSGHYLHFWRQLFLHLDVLANPSLQRLWSRSCRCWYPWDPSGLQHSSRCLHCAMAVECVQRTQQGAHDCFVNLDDSRLVLNSLKVHHWCCIQPAYMIPGCGSLAIARVDNLNQLWGLLVLAGLGIGGIVVPASIITTIICPDVSLPPQVTYRIALC